MTIETAANAAYLVAALLFTAEA